MNADRSDVLGWMDEGGSLVTVWCLAVLMRQMELDQLMQLREAVRLNLGSGLACHLVSAFDSVRAPWHHSKLVRGGPVVVYE